MPELPEIETIRRGIEEHVLGKTISRCRVLRRDVVKAGVSLAGKTAGQRVISTDRKGKYLVLNLHKGISILFHLGMSGKLLFTERTHRYPRHTHLSLTFRDDPRFLLFVDPRRFGKVALSLTDTVWDCTGGVKNLGPDALSVTARELAARLQSRKRGMKSLLLEQSFVAGIGNIYADEILHDAGIHPTRQASRLTEDEIRGLHRSMNRILKRAIRAGGSSVDDYIDLEGNVGRFQNSHRVYGRIGESCFECGATVQKLIISSRTTAYCPKCQPRRK